MPRTFAKLPMPFFVQRDIEAGLTLTQIADKYGIMKLGTVHNFIKRHDLPMPPRGRPGKPKAPPKKSIEPVYRDRSGEAPERRFPRPDQRKIVIEKFNEFWKPSGQPVAQRISLPRLTFLHGHWDGTDALYKPS